MERFVRENLEDMISHLGELVAIDSVYAEDGGEGAPFGARIRAALDYVLELARSFGFSVRDYDGYAAEITAGTGKRMIGVLCHADVVAAGTGWDTDPFTLTRKDGRLYGRGASDDKGPLISCLYVMKYLLDSGRIPPDACVRMIVGADEEEGWGCIRHYLEHAGVLPEVSIVPDGNFPLIFCEKGLLDFDLVSEHRIERGAPVQLVSVTGGGSRNIVPDAAQCVLECADPDAVLQTLSGAPDTQARAEDGQVVLQARGKSTHCMSPEKGKNAIAALFAALARLGGSLSHHALVEAFGCALGEDYTGERFGCAMRDAASGALTFNVGAVRMDAAGAVTLECDLRYPASVSYETVRDLTAAGAVKNGFVYHEVDRLPPVYHERSSPLVTALLDAYREVTGDTDSQPLSIGGATYARALPNAVAFGPLFPWEEELAHEPNEFLAEESLAKMTVIFARALEKLLAAPGM
ncbi:Sapep family Mn(2+)-dependent dipeptidase [Agathobaculum sp.]|uniref:Sapep family Mn(2+)-dependent dipeptidase n=1 Tax=Agathobaculum sp. TaxID=2048138 RepID=UPI002A802C35|nr:Sapep family Mn(2+)-dependent dipeptidase [Agathobaculum sp.]MDY3618302.1 Sapep family Mn(2+)-dependent dipeptidase [Agathobaculum sp.]